jgi:hypothetical protein
MAEDLVRGESPLEFFKEQVEGAMERQRVKTSEWTAFYVVNLLAAFVTPSGGGASDDDPLGMRLVRALQADGVARRQGLKSVGDASLFLVGFFSDSLTRRLVDVDYYVSLGGSAYLRLAEYEDDAFADVFGEMAAKFMPLVDVLADISDRAALASNRDLLRLYDRWMRTGSHRDGNLLAEKGLVPAPSPPRRLQ